MRIALKQLLDLVGTLDDTPGEGTSREFPALLTLTVKLMVTTPLQRTLKE